MCEREREQGEVQKEAMSLNSSHVSIVEGCWSSPLSTRWSNGGNTSGLVEVSRTYFLVTNWLVTKNLFIKSEISITFN